MNFKKISPKKATFATSALIVFLVGTFGGFSGISGIAQQAAIASDTSTEVQIDATPEPIVHAPPLPILSTTEEQELFQIAKNLPSLKQWAPDGWQLVTIDFRGTEKSPQWTHATVQMKLPPTVEAQKDCAEGWGAMVEIDLNTKEVGVSDIPSASNDQCGGVEFGGKLDDSASPVEDSNSLIPQAFAATTKNGYAIVRQYDVMGVDDSHYGNLVYLKTPTISSSIYVNMNRFVGQLLNAYFGSGKFEQIGWAATSLSLCSGCGVPANSKAIIYVDQSVFGNLYGHNTNLAWINGATLLVEHICQSNGKYGQEMLYNGQSWGHFTNVPCTTAQVQNDSINNSVWFENSNTVAKPPSGWAPYITSAVTAQNAYEARNSVNGWVKWSTSVNSDADCSGTFASNVITGSLVNGATASWSSLSQIPSRRTC